MDFLDNMHEGFNAATQEDLDQLNKALGTGTEGAAYGGDGYADMSPLRPQSLEPTLRSVTATMANAKFWRSIGKDKAFNTVEEFNVVDSYGGDSSPFFVDGGLPNEEDSHFVRRSQFVKFLGTTRSVTLGAQMVRNVAGDLIAQQTQHGTEWLIQQLERSLYFADSRLDPLAFDGVLAQVDMATAGKSYRSQHVIDMRGRPIDELTLEDIATIIMDNYGSGSLSLHMTNQINKDMSKAFIGTTGVNGYYSGRQRTEAGESIRMGQPIRGYDANVASIDFVNNIFMKPQNEPKAASQKGAPATVTIAGVTTPVAAAADATSLHTAATYYYFVAAKNSAGESAPTTIGSAAADNGQAINITFNRTVSDPVANTYRVYRGTTANVADARLMVEVKDAGTGTTQTVVDRNFDLPGTHTAMLIDNDKENVVKFKQLAPLMKKNLAAISAADRFMLLLFGMVQLYNPRKVVVLKNVGLLGMNSNRLLTGPVYDQPSFGTTRPV